MKKLKPNKDQALQYVYDLGIEGAAKELKITTEELENILEPKQVDYRLHKNNYQDIPINALVADVIANNYDYLRAKFVEDNKTLSFSQTDEDIFHSTLLKVMEDTEIIEDKILDHIAYKLNMIRFQIKQDHKAEKKCQSYINPNEEEQNQ